MTSRPGNPCRPGSAGPARRRRPAGRRRRPAAPARRPSSTPARPGEPLDQLGRVRAAAADDCDLHRSPSSSWSAHSARRTGSRARTRSRVRRPIRLIGRVAVHVVPDRAHRLDERPGPAALPRQLGRAEVVPQHLPRAGLEQVPGRHQIQRRIGRTEPADVERAGQPTALDQDVAGDQVAMAHHVRRRSPRQHPRVRPASSRAASASAASHARASATSRGTSGNRAASRSPRAGRSR